MKADYVIRTGETLFLALDVKEGDFSIVTSVTAKLKPAGPNGAVPSVSTPVTAEFVVSSRSATVSLPAGWDLVITDEVTATIKPGFYVADAKIAYNTGVAQKTEPVLIEIKGGIT